MKQFLNMKEVWAEFLNGFKKPHLLKTLFNYLLIVIGSVILAFGDEVFKIPNQIVSGGVSSLGIVAEQLFNWNAEITITVLQWGLFVIGTLILGLDFGLKTLISTIIYPVFLFVFEPITSVDFFNIAKYITEVNGGTPDPVLSEFLSGVAGGVLVGLGVGICFKGGGSTGGVDVISLSLTKFFNIKASITSFIVDMIIIFSSVLVTKSIVPIIIGSIAAYLCAIFIDHLYLGTNNTYCALIVSSKWKEINKQINDILSRGTTLTDAYGGYTGNNKVLILSVFSRSEYETIQKIVYRTDDKAFVTIIQGHEVNGEGFRQIPKRLRTEIEKERKDPSFKALEKTMENNEKSNNGSENTYNKKGE